MEINTPTKAPRTVIDWIIYFTNGTARTITIDAHYGDEAHKDITNRLYTFHLSEKPSPIDPDQILLANDIDVPFENTLYVERTARVIRELTLEERDAWRERLHAVVRYPTK